MGGLLCLALKSRGIGDVVAKAFERESKSAVAVRDALVLHRKLGSERQRLRALG